VHNRDSGRVIKTRHSAQRIANNKSVWNAKKQTGTPFKNAQKNNKNNCNLVNLNWHGTPMSMQKQKPRAKYTKAIKL